MALDVSKPVRVAAVQMDGRVADVPYNLEQAEKLAGEALDRGARIVGLPEFFTTPVSFDARLSRCALPPDNPAIEMMKRLARRHGACIGGSMLMRKGADVFNTYCFVQPDGAAFTHDKDIPTMWENAFYVGGSDDGVMDTAIGPVGAAVCWELIRTRTVDRLLGKIRLAMTGSNWWTGPANWPLLPRLLCGRRAAPTGALAAEAPIRFARLLGVPVIHAGQAGRFEGRFLSCRASIFPCPTRRSFWARRRSSTHRGASSQAANRTRARAWRWATFRSSLRRPRSASTANPSGFRSSPGFT